MIVENGPIQDDICTNGGQLFTQLTAPNLLNITDQTIVVTSILHLAQRYIFVINDKQKKIQKLLIGFYIHCIVSKYFAIVVIFREDNEKLD